MFNFAVDYYLTTLVASIGVIQLAASLNNLKGLLVFKSPLIARILGLASPVVAVVWFFTTDTRNINDYEGGLDSNDQAFLFLLGALTAVIATILLTSIMNSRMIERESKSGNGLDSLAHSNYARALRRSLKNWWRNWRA